MPSKKKKYNSRFPPARIKKIMQKDEEVGKVAAAVPVIISRALELFIDSLMEKTAAVTRGKQAKTLSASHIKQAIHSEKTFDFLRDLVKNVPDHQTEDDVEYPGPSTSSANIVVPEKKPRIGRPRKEGARGPGRPRKVRPEETQELKASVLSDSDEETETDEGDNYESDTGVGPSPPPQGARPSDFLIQGDRRDQTSTAQYNMHVHGGQVGPVPTMSQQPFGSGNTGMQIPSSVQQQGGQPPVSSGAYDLQGGSSLQPGMMMRPPLPQVTSTPYAAPFVTSSQRALQSESSAKQPETTQSNPPQHFNPQHFPPGFPVPNMPFQQYPGMMGAHGQGPPHAMGSGHFMPPQTMPGGLGFPHQFMPGQPHPGMMAPNMGPMMSLLSGMRHGPPPLVPISSTQENQDPNMPLDMSINNKNRSQEGTTTTTIPMVTLSQIPTPTWAPPSLHHPQHFQQGFPGAGMYGPTPGVPHKMPYFGSHGEGADGSRVPSGCDNVISGEQKTDKRAQSISPKADDGDVLNRKKDAVIVSSSAYIQQDIKKSECDNNILNFAMSNANTNNFSENGKHSDLSGQRESVIVKGKDLPGSDVKVDRKTVSFSGLANFMARPNVKVDTGEDDDYDA